MFIGKENRTIDCVRKTDALIAGLNLAAAVISAAGAI